MDAIFVEEMPRSRVAVLLKHFSELADGREPWRIAYPLAEVLLLLTCATITGCDDFDDIVAWGGHHLDFLRRFSAFHHAIPCVRWLQTLVNRLDPELFGRCFESWIKELWPGRHDLIAIDGLSALFRSRGFGARALASSGPARSATQGVAGWSPGPADAPLLRGARSTSSGISSRRPHFVKSQA
jgi:hypothetical protein